MGQQRFDKEGELVPVSIGGLDAQLDRVVQAEPARAFLMVAAGDRPGRVFAISRNTVLLGRSPDAEICLNDPSVSNEHARIINGGLGYEVEDLQSRNGTFVGGRRVGKARLANGDRLRVGTVELTFLLDGAPEATIALASSTVTMASVVAPQPMRRLGPAREAEEEGPSVEEMVRRGVRAYRMLRRHAAVVGVLVGAGSVLGLASIAALPPAPSASAVIKLSSEVKSNPVQQESGRQETVMFFVGAERAFTSEDLIASTLERLGQPNDEDDVKSAGKRLKFEGLGDQAYSASFNERLFSRGSADPALFLSTHINNYVQTEVDKTLKVFKGSADFLRNQLVKVDADLATLNAETVKFREEHADQLQDQGLSTGGATRLQLDMERSALMSQLQKITSEIQAEERLLKIGAPLAQTKNEGAQTYKLAVQQAQTKLQEARARGLADEHPEVKQLLAEKAAAEQTLASELKSETTAFEMKANPAYQAMSTRVGQLRSERDALATRIRDLGGSISRFRKVAADLPKIDTELAVKLERLKTLQSHRTTVFDKLKNAETQLELERVSVASRFELLSAPKLERPGKAKTAAQRLGIGLMAGLFVAALVIALREGRRLVKHALSTMAETPAP